MIVVNGRFMTQNLTGVQRYARGITRMICARSDVEVVVPRSAEILPEYSDIPLVRYGPFGGHTWEQLVLPSYVRRRRGILLNLGSTGPALLRRQVVTNHDITYVRYPASFARSFRILYRTLTPVLLRSAKAIVTVSEFSKGEISNFFRVDASKFFVVPNAVDSGFTPGASSQALGYLLAVSSPSAHKNFGRLLEAYSQLPFPKPRLVIAGSTAPALIRPDLVDSPGVSFVGRLTDDELVDMYRGATAFVFPSLYEGFGIPPLEAQSCGVPVIAPNIPSAREVLGESAVYADPTSVGSLAAAIRTVIEMTPTERHKMTALGLANVQRFSWAGSANAIMDLVDGVFGDSAIHQASDRSVA